MIHIYEVKGPVDLKEVRRRLLYNCGVNFIRKIGLKPKLRTYMTIKEEYCVEEYVVKYLPRMQRCLLAQLRCGILPLEIEIDRFKLKKDANRKMRHMYPDERICKLCNNGVEKELHFMCECTLYE